MDYDHLEEKQKAGVEEANVDITEHRVPLSALGGHMKTSINTKDRGGLHGPTAAEAAPRLQRDILNSRVKFDKMGLPFDKRQILGDATETGLTRFAGRALSSGYDQHQKAFPKVFEVPFNSTNKWALVILNKAHSGGVLTAYIKGAPERVLAKCSTYLKDGVMHPVTNVTGDHPKTAEAIARKINLIIGDTRETLAARTGREVDEVYEDEVSAVVIYGDDIDGLQGRQWDQIFSKEEIVFARTSPKHKLEIVKRAQALDHIVGAVMVLTIRPQEGRPGDCHEHFGFATTPRHAMLANFETIGSDVSKEAANMILLDDNFASTVNPVSLNSKLDIRILTFIFRYTLSHSTPKVIPQLLYVVVPIPLTSICDSHLGYRSWLRAICGDKPETVDGLMRMAPRKPVSDRSILSLKKKALWRTKTLRRDPETQEVVQPSKLSVMMGKLRKPFTRTYWEDAMESNEGETLVDGKLLSYAYLEAGVIEMLGALVAYFVVFFESGFSPAE
ncbi:hypothetical protein C8R47DRAFT_1230916 [Mycena vitilis]|nr:hypothetical protein C8R47DRAFT_1230916 [Mycena vitilis]